MPFVIYSLRTGHVVSTHPTETGARISLAHAKNRFVRQAKKRSAYYADSASAAAERGRNARAAGRDLKIMDSVAFYRDVDVMVTRKNLISGKEFQIRASDAGSCCDPSTETYWSM